MFKLMQPLYDAVEVEENGGKWFKLPQMVFKKGGSDGETLAYFDPNDFSVAKIEPYTWYNIPLKSTGVTFTDSDMIYCNIINTSGSGIKFMIDELSVFNGKDTTSIQPPTPTPAPDIEIEAPRFYKDGKEITDVIKGSVECRITIKNNTSISAEVPSAMIIAVYESSGVLVSTTIGKGACLIDAGGKSELTADVDIPDMSADKYHAKILLWDDLEGIRPAHAVWTINNNAIN